MFKNILSVILISLSLSIPFSSNADSKGEYGKIQDHWKMILNEKDTTTRNNMIKEHRMMLDNFDKNEGMSSQPDGMQGNNMHGMQGNHMNGMSENKIHMMNSMRMQRLEMDMME